MNAEPNVDIGGFDSGAGLLGYNVYAYCANNPVNFVDFTGEAIVSPLALFGLAVIGSGAIAGTSYFISTPQFQQAWQQTCNFIKDYAVGVPIRTHRSIKSVISKISQIKKQPNYKWTGEKHHIVVLYNSTYIDKTKCPTIIKNSGEHIAMLYYQNGEKYWNYTKIKNAIEN